MNRVTLALVVILAAFILGGVGGWHVRKAYEPKDPEPITDADSTLNANAQAVARADSFLVDTVYIPIYIRTNGAKQALAAADTGWIFGILDAEPRAE